MLDETAHPKQLDNFEKERLDETAHIRKKSNEPVRSMK